MRRAADLQGRRVATAYPVTTAAYFADAGVDVQVVPIHGSVELAPRLDAAEAIVDLVSSGETLRSERAAADRRPCSSRRPCCWRGPTSTPTSGAPPSGWPP